MKKHQLTSFYLEALLLVVVFVAMILVLTGVFGAARKQSVEAKTLTNAVLIAQNAAEAVSASDSPEALLSLLDENGNARLRDGQLEATYRADGSPCTEDFALRVTVTWEIDAQNAALVTSRIAVYGADGETPVYALETARYRKGDAA